MGFLSNKIWVRIFLGHPGTWITNLCRSCFSTFCIPVGPAFTVSEFDSVDGLGLAFDVFCVTLLFLASQSLLLLNCWHCQELLYYFFD